MLRLRRYRVFLIFAFFVTLAVYRFSSVRDWEAATSAIHVEEGLKKLGLSEYYEGATAKLGTSGTVADTSVGGVSAGQSVQEAEKVVPAPAAVAPAVVEGSAEKNSAAKEVQKEKEATTSTAAAVKGFADSIKTLAPVRPSSSAAAATAAIAKASDTFSIKEWDDIDTEEPFLKPSADEEKFGQVGLGRIEPAITIPKDDLPHWKKMPEHFPLPKESLIPLPTGKSAKIPKIQAKSLDSESRSEKELRLKRLATVKEAFVHSWTGYKDHAWTKDELSPVSGAYKDPFGGWGATLVDTLDTLWIMGLTGEFEMSLGAIKTIDFTTSVRKDIPMFETTIRYLGGLLGAYDISGQKYEILLTKAKELAEVLIAAFDTPNRMPQLFYNWAP